MIRRVLGGFALGAVCAMPLLAFAQEPAAARILLHRTRQSASDLEISGELAGVPKGQTRYVRYGELLTLPMESHMVTGDTNFVKPVRVSGVRLEMLPRLLGARRDAGMVTAVCDDAYAAHYPAEYLKAHHPLLVLRVNGQPPPRWPIGTDGVPMGPYMISHASYTPSFHVLAHNDEAQVPWGVVRLEFRNEQEVYAPIVPAATYRQNAAVQQGFVVAKQNCFRCHSSAGEGGLKSNRSWSIVARRSVNEPEYFDAYVLHPKKENPASQMSASPQYDAATLRVLRAYFKTFEETDR